MSRIYTSIRSLRESAYRFKRDDAKARETGSQGREDVTLAAHLPDLNRAPIQWAKVSIPARHPAERRS
ncbi:MAG: hypothetical protein ACI9VS_001912 [Candidatus Binatia bacterium]|jgi:hypothetical protein